MGEEMAEDPKVYYNVPGYGEALGIMNAIVDRDGEVERPSVNTARWNVLKYVIRAPRKNKMADYKKALDYLRQIVDGAEED